MNKYFKYFFFIVIPFLSFIILIAQFTVPNPSFKTNEALLSFAETKQEKKGACKSYLKLLAEDSTNSKYQYLLGREWCKIDEKELDLFKFSLRKKGVSPIEMYDRFSKSSDQEVKNSGHFGKACILYFDENHYMAEKHLDSISNKNHIGYNLLKGLISEKREKYQKAFSHYLKESKNKELSIESNLKLYHYLYSWEEYDKAKLFLKLPNFRAKIASNKERDLYYKTGNALKYLSVLHQHIFRKIDLMGFIAAFIVMIVWMLYLLKLSLLSNTKKSMLFLATFISLFLIYPTLVLYDFMDIEWNFNISQNSINDLIYCIFGIGFIEEFCKLIPLLILILFRPSSIKTPMDIILIACLSAVGYSFVENLIYFTSDRLDIISSRAMISVVGHVADTSIAAYGIVILRFKERSIQNIIKSIAYFFVAMFMHGVFDFWLINNDASYFHYLSYFVLFIEIFIWVKILNYCLNNSNAYKNKRKININRFNFILLTLLSSIVCIEFLSFAFRHGTEDSFPVLKDSVIQGLFLIPYLSYRLSRIDIAPPGKKDIEIVSKNTAYHLNEILNQTAEITAFRKYGVITEILPSTGVIMERLNISGDNNWFEFIPNKELSLNGKIIHALLIKSKKGSINLNSKDVIIHLRVQFKGEESYKLEHLPFIDWGVLNVKK